MRKTTIELERLVMERWPKLKERALNDRAPEILIAILEEIDDILFVLEMRIAAEIGNLPAIADVGRATDDRQFASDILNGDPEIGSQ